MTTFNGHNGNEAERLASLLSLIDSADQDGIRLAWNQTANLDSDLTVDQNLKANVRANLMAAVADTPSVSPSVESGVPSFPRRSILRLVSVRTFAVAASILVLVGLSFILSPDVHVISAPVGSQTAISFDLPDGSSGYLSAGSELRYSDTFGDNTRLVALKGEAVFDVTKTGTSFVVQTYDARVSVLGTSFAVRSWAGDVEPETVVSVREGSVVVEKRYNNVQRVELVPSQQIRIEAGSDVLAEQVVSTTENTFSWVRGGVDFVNMPIGNVLSELSRRYDIVLKAPSNIRDRRITLLPSQHASIDDLLVDMSAAVNIRYRKIAGGFEFYLD